MNQQVCSMEKVFNNNKLRITLLPVVPDEVYETTDLAEILEHQLCNGWTLLRPEQIGALTEAPILSDDVELDDYGDVVKVGQTFWYPDDYQVKCPVTELITYGHVDFTLAN